MEEERGRDSDSEAGHSAPQPGWKLSPESGEADHMEELQEPTGGPLNPETHQQTGAHGDAHGSEPRAAGEVDSGGETEETEREREPAQQRRQADMRETAAPRSTMEGRLERQNTEDRVDLPAHVLARLRGM